MVVKTEREKTILREGGKKLAMIMDKVARAVEPGVGAADLDSLAEGLILSCGGRPSFKGFQSREGKIYPASLCVSVNEEVVHAIPHKGKILREGDIVSLDLGMWYQGYATDMAVTVCVGKASKGSQELIVATKKALLRGIRVARAGKHVGDIGAAIEKYVRGKSLSVVKELGGHGVGLAVHEDPIIPNFGKFGEGKELKVGEVLAIEPMVSTGSGEVKELSDGWTWVTKDGKPAAHFEHTIMITENGAEILTKI